MDGNHLLNLRALASEEVGDFALLRFEGREAISEPFDYRLELIVPAAPGAVEGWIGQLVEWDLTHSDGGQRVFAGRIYEAEVRSHEEAVYRVLLRVRPAYHATAYARATHFIQDRTSQQIFEAVTAEVPGLVTTISLSPAPPTRTMTVRYDETEFDFLQRVLAQDGIMYFFTYDEGAAPYRHRMHLANAASAYLDVPDSEDMALHTGTAGDKLAALGHARRARPSRHEYHAIDPNKADTPWQAEAAAIGSWGQVYPHAHEDHLGEAGAAGDVSGRSTPGGDAYAQIAETVSGQGDNIQLFAGGRVAASWDGSTLAPQLVLVAVSHSAFDPWYYGDATTATYTNSFVAIDATKAYRPPVPNGRRRAPGPLLGTVKADGRADGEIAVDDQSRVPVEITAFRPYASSPKPLTDIVWLPVQQQWAAGTHGAQFFPRIGAKVVIDFFYGDPDLPFVAGTIYTPSAKYPFDVASKVTQTGWRSITDKNGSITQEFHFEDKPGAEEVYLYTGRDYRRLIDQDEWGTIKRDQTIAIERDQSLEVKNNRTIKVTAKEDHSVTQTRTLTVTQKSLHESQQEIEIKVGPSSIKLTMQGIEINAPTIKINATATLDVSAGAASTHKAPMVQSTADAMMVIKGGIVMIN